MRYQIILDIGLCTTKSVPRRCHFTTSYGCKQANDKKAATSFPGKTNFNCHLVTILLPKEKSLSVRSAISRQGSWVKHLTSPTFVLGLRSTHDQPQKGHLPLNQTSLLELFRDFLEGWNFWKKERQREREKKKVWIFKEICKLSNSAAPLPRGRMN